MNLPETLLHWVHQCAQSASCEAMPAVDLKSLVQELVAAGAADVGDFAGLSAAEALQVWSPLGSVPLALLQELLARAPAIHALERKRGTDTVDEAAPVSAAKLPRHIPTSFARAALQESCVNDFAAALEAVFY